MILVHFPGIKYYQHPKALHCKKSAHFNHYRVRVYLQEENLEYFAARKHLEGLGSKIGII